MIHSKTHVVTAENCEGSPFYLFVTNERVKKLPLPVAIKSRDPEALAWRNRWEACTNPATKAYCFFHPILRNWVGGLEDGSRAVQECEDFWGNQEP